MKKFNLSGGLGPPRGGTTEDVGKQQLAAIGEVVPRDARVDAKREPPTYLR
jgi:hypothetical protein